LSKSRFISDLRKSSTAEAEAGVDDDAFVTPLKTKEALVAQAPAIADARITAALANTAEAEAGTNTAKLMTPARTAEAIAALVPPTETIEQLNDVFTGSVTTGSTSTTYLGFSGISHCTVSGSFDFSGAAKLEYATSVDNGASFSGYTQIMSATSFSGPVHRKFNLPAGTNGLRLQLIRTANNLTNTLSCLVLGVRT